MGLTGNPIAAPWFVQISISNQNIKYQYLYITTIKGTQNMWNVNNNIIKVNILNKITGDNIFLQT